MPSAVDKLPTAAKLIAAMFMGLSAIATSFIAMSKIQDLDRQIGPVIAISCVVYVLVGWRTMGRMIGQAKHGPFVIGLRSAVTAFFWTLFYYGVATMISGIMVFAYYEPITAVLQIPSAMIAYGKVAKIPEIGGALVLLPIISAYMARTAKAKWDKKVILE